MSSMNAIRRHWPLVLAMAVLWAYMGVAVGLSVHRNDGHLAYGLDDAYIHMAMARNFTQHGVWGVTRHEFSSSTSSPLWTLLLSGVFAIFGPLEAAPLAINLLMASAILIAAYTLFRKTGVGSLPNAVLLLAIIFLSPLPVLIISGLEHTLHLLLMFLLVSLAAGAICRDGDGDTASRRRDAMLLVLAALSAATRYESLFILFPAGVLLLLRRRFALAVGLGIASLLPLAVYGLISLAHGWYFLPHSVLLKGNTPRLSSLTFLHWPGVEVMCRMWFNPHVGIIFLAAIVLSFVDFARPRRFWKADSICRLLLIAAIFLHMQFARSGWFFRYEAYLIAMGIFILGPTLVSSIRLGKWKEGAGPLPRWLAGVATAAILAACLPRAIEAHGKIVWATENIHQQQCQMARFLAAFYSGQAVAANDVGAINYYADIRCVDLWGLANFEVGRLKLAGLYRTERMAAIVRDAGASIAVAYDDYFDDYGGLPKEWIKVAQWRIPNNTVCFSPNISFFAINPAAAAELRSNLEKFAPELPPAVEFIRMRKSGE